MLQNHRIPRLLCSFVKFSFSRIKILTNSLTEMSLDPAFADRLKPLLSPSASPLKPKSNRRSLNGGAPLVGLTSPKARHSRSLSDTSMFYSPSANGSPSKMQDVFSDRFIPSRVGSNLSLEIFPESHHESSSPSDSKCTSRLSSQTSIP